MGALQRPAAADKPESGAFSLLGTTFGGDGRVNFALPNLQGRTPIHIGAGHTLGEIGGNQTHTVTISELPTHTHVLLASLAAGNSKSPVNNILAGALNAYRSPAALTSLSPGAVVNTGGSQAHFNMQPFLTMNFCIALQGIFPSQN